MNYEYHVAVVCSFSGPLKTRSRTLSITLLAERHAANVQRACPINLTAQTKKFNMMPTWAYGIWKITVFDDRQRTSNLPVTYHRLPATYRKRLEASRIRSTRSKNNIINIINVTIWNSYSVLFLISFKCTFIFLASQKDLTVANLRANECHRSNQVEGYVWE